MRIQITCARCGKRYEVDGAFAGKRGKCAACGARVMIPGDDQVVTPPSPEPDAYELDQQEDSAHSTSFTPALGSESPEVPRPLRVKGRKPSSSSRTRSEPAGSSRAISGKQALMGLGCVLAAAGLIAVFAPGARASVGGAVALVGLILFAYGYASGAYIAFTEDDLYGWLYLIFPPFAAYYFVSRWDEMSSRLVMLIVGLTMLTGGGRMLEAARAPDAGAKEGIAAPP
jgi:DNA-directed RNA polymerase subunit RPC12/RpoP